MDIKTIFPLLMQMQSGANLDTKEILSLMMNQQPKSNGATNVFPVDIANENNGSNATMMALLFAMMMQKGTNQLKMQPSNPIENNDDYSKTVGTKKIESENIPHDSSSENKNGFDAIRDLSAEEIIESLKILTKLSRT